MEGIFDILKKNGVLKFFERLFHPEPVVHDAAHDAKFCMGKVQVVQLLKVFILCQNCLALLLLKLTLLSII